DDRIDRDGHRPRPAFSLLAGKIQGKIPVGGRIMTTNSFFTNNIDPICATSGRGITGKFRECRPMVARGSGRAITLVYNIIVDLDQKMAPAMRLAFAFLLHP